MIRHIVQALVLVGASLALATEARASEQFPDFIATNVGTDRVPACTICHASLSGGAGTVVKPFGQYLRSRGLASGSTASLKNALAAMTAEKHDTDGDGILDIDELKAGSDPNGSANTSVAPIEYGCGGGHVAPRATSDDLQGVSWLIAAIGFLALTRARTRRP